MVPAAQVFSTLPIQDEKVRIEHDKYCSNDEEDAEYTFASIH